MRTSLSHWEKLWSELNACGGPSPWHHRLVAAYSEPTRHYHNLQHLSECLTELDAVRAELKQPALVEAALWFHDAVYDARSSSNEEESADLARECLSSAQISDAMIDRVHELVLSTKTHRAQEGSDTAVLVDIDLSILGQRPERFWVYEQGIRSEYAWVPAQTYREKRSDILKSFLARPAIYTTTHFSRKYEAAAHVNLTAAIKQLEASAS